MTRDDEIKAIVEVGRRTRTPVPRGLWIAAAIVGGICTTGLAVAWLGEAAPAPAGVQRAAPPTAGFATGLVVGAAGGLVVGFALARQRRDHSSRNTP